MSSARPLNTSQISDLLNKAKAINDLDKALEQMDEQKQESDKEYAAVQAKALSLLAQYQAKKQQAEAQSSTLSTSEEKLSSTRATK